MNGVLRLRCALATSGPGETNVVTAIAGAYYDSVPIRCTMGRVGTYSRKKVEWM